MDNNQEQKAAEKYPEGSAGYLDKRAGYIAAMEDAENAFLENLIEELPSLQIKSFTPPFRVGRAQKRAILDSEGKEVGVFKTGSEEMAQIFCDYLNGANQLPGVEEWVEVKSESDFPADEKCRYWIANENGVFDFFANREMIVSKFNNKTLTHYKKLTETLPPPTNT